MNPDDPTPTPFETTPAPPGATVDDWLTAARTAAEKRTAPDWIEAHLVTRFEERHAMASRVSAPGDAVAERRPSDAQGVLAPASGARVDGTRTGTSAPRASTRVTRPRRPSPRWAWFGWWLAAPSFTLLAIAAGLIVLAPGHIRSNSWQMVEGGGIEPPRFIALAPLDDIAADSGPRVVAARVPRAAIAGFGLPVDPARADQPLNAEFLVSARGVVLGVRFLE